MKGVRVKHIFVFIWLAVIFSAISYIFWYTDWQYSLPTPVPEHYKAVAPGTHIELAGKLPLNKRKPNLIHFFNPSCPCSRFNMTHFQSLVRCYGDRVNFSMVVLSKNNHTEKDIQDQYDLAIPVSFDTAIATICGVYATPQAVLIDAQGNLYYRGNYNKSRYCTEKSSNYAQMAIDSLLGNTELGGMDELAIRPYGCQLPTCKK